MLPRVDFAERYIIYIAAIIFSYGNIVDIQFHLTEILRCRAAQGIFKFIGIIQRQIYLKRERRVRCLCVRQVCRNISDAAINNDILFSCLFIIS